MIAQPFEPVVWLLERFAAPLEGTAFRTAAPFPLVYTGAFLLHARESVGGTAFALLAAVNLVAVVAHQRGDRRDR